MPIFKISAALKKADRDIDDPTARCIDCEYPTEKGNPLKFLGVTPDKSRELFGHVNCSSFRDRENEKLEEEAREREGIFAFSSKFRYIANIGIDNSTVEATFPMLDNSKEVGDMTTKQVDANYQDGAPVPPKH